MRVKVIAIIWPTAYHLRQNIINDLISLTDCHEYKQVTLDLSNKLKDFIFSLYDESDFEEYGYLYKQKLEFIRQRTSSSKVCVVYFDVKSMSQLTDIKLSIRQKYKSLVDHYVYDIIIHITSDIEEYKRTNRVVSLFSEFINHDSH